MKQIKVKMPIYTGDVSGVPAALYELGGMVVMHDASGCNSTYNSHDELRWYDMESLIYISGLTHIDAILGNDEKLIREIAEAAKDLKPRFIAIASTPIPYMMGMDFRALIRELEERTGIPSFFVPTNGTHSYVYGAGQAFLKYTQTMFEAGKQVQRIPTEKIKVNILGVTPLDFALTSFTDSVKKWLLQNQMEPVSCFAMGSSLEEIDRTMEADVNLVVSSTGYLMAQYLEKERGIPFVTGTPTGKLKEVLIQKIEHAACTGKSVYAYERKQEEEAELYIVGEAVISSSLAYAITAEKGIPTRVFVPTECPEGLLFGGDGVIDEEEDLIHMLQKAKTVIADELLWPFCPKESQRYPLPHVACSGRVYAEEMPDLTKYSF